MENKLLMYEPRMELLPIEEEPIPGPLMSVNVCGTIVPVVFVDGLKAEDGDSCDGLFIDSVPFIAVDSSLHTDRALAIVLHEIGHAVMLFSGAGYLLDRRCKKGQSSEAEEEIMRVFLPAFNAAVQTWKNQ